MIIKVKTSADIPSSEITPERSTARAASSCAGRRAAAAPRLAGDCGRGGDTARAPRRRRSAGEEVGLHRPKVDPLNTFEQITTYNNYYEFGTDKSDPARERRSSR